MIVPCIDLQAGKAVQLVRGRRRVLEVEDVFGLLESFRRYSFLHVIDLDAAMRRGRNDRLARSLCQRASNEFGMKVRVGGGIRTVARAARVAEWGADKVIVGSAAFRAGRVDHKFLMQLTAKLERKRVMLALDTDAGYIVVRGWSEKLRLRAEDVIPELEKYCAEFLCTYVDAEGTMKGTNLKWFRALRRTTQLPITAAGGIRSHREVRALERMNMNAAVGMAMYRGKIS